MKSINPYTGEFIQNYEEHSSEHIQSILEKSEKAFAQWRRSSFSERSEFLNAVAKKLKNEKQSLALMMTQEMGKPIAQAIKEVEKCALCCEFYADKAEAFLRDETPDFDKDKKALVRYEPLGPVLAIMPWNFPLWQVVRFAAPALMAGNTVLLKHASNVTGSALDLEKIFQNKSIANVFQTLLVPGSKASQLIENKIIKAVSLTGSTPAGRSVAAAAGGSIKKVVLELGGSDPYIVFEDADLVSAAKLCAQSRLQNSGQSCIAAKRFLVHKKVKQEFLSLLKSEFSQQKMGDPADPNTTIGTQARISLRDDLHKQVQESVKKGARLVIGGHIPEGKAAFYPPTILDNVSPGQPAFDEELFGPVAAIIEFSSETEAIDLANNTQYGLGSAVFTKNTERALKISYEIQSGSVFINDFVKSDPRLPFGGIKDSGLGRELSSYGIKEFVNVKTVVVSQA